MSVLKPHLARPRRVNIHEKHLSRLSFNEKMLLTFGKVLGSPWTVYLFFLIAGIGLTQVTNLSQGIQWFSQTFVQFVALAILQGASNLQSKRSEVREEEEYKKICHQDKEMDYIINTIDEIKDALHSHWQR